MTLLQAQQTSTAENIGEFTGRARLSDQLQEVDPWSTLSALNQRVTGMKQLIWSIQILKEVLDTYPTMPVDTSREGQQCKSVNGMAPCSRIISLKISRFYHEIQIFVQGKIWYKKPT
jgi:hypothetical protein